jgi:hypothetical protein
MVAQDNEETLPTDKRADRYPVNISYGRCEMTFEYYFIERNGLWQERLAEVAELGFEQASPIARMIYECERGNINQHASEDLKWISAQIAMLEDMMEGVK